MKTDGVFNLDVSSSNERGKPKDFGNLKDPSDSYAGNPYSQIISKALEKLAQTDP